MADPKQTFDVVRPPFKRSAESEKLFEHLLSLNEGVIVSYESIMLLIQEDPTRGAGYAIVKGVRERLIKDQSVVWFVIPTVGIQRATAVEMLEISDGNLRGIKRKITRTGRITKAAASQYAELSTEAKTEFNFLTSVIGALNQFFDRGKQKQIKAKIEQTQLGLDSTAVLEMFSKR